MTALSVILGSCSKDSKNLPQQVVQNNPENVKASGISPEEIQTIQQDFATFQKDPSSKNKALANIPVATAVDYFEVILNSKFCVKDKDVDYAGFNTRTYNFSLPNMANGTLTGLTQVLSQVQNFTNTLSNLTLPAGHQLILADVEPVKTTLATIEFTLTVIDAAPVPMLVFKKPRITYFSLDWHWGDGESTQNRTWGCDPDDLNPRTGEQAGACGVLTTALRQALKPAIPNLCGQGFYSTRVKSFGLNPANILPHQEKYYRHLNPTGGLLYHYTLNLRIDDQYCVSGSDLQNVWMPYLLNIAKEEANISENPYRLVYGSDEYVKFIAIRSAGGPLGEGAWAHSFIGYLNDPVCQGGLGL